MPASLNSGNSFSLLLWYGGMLLKMQNTTDKDWTETNPRLKMMYQFTSFSFTGKTAGVMPTVIKLKDVMKKRFITYH